MVKIGDIGNAEFFSHMRAATLDRIRTGPMIAAQAMALRRPQAASGPRVPLAEAQRVLAQLKARNERGLNRERRQSIDDNFEPMSGVDPATRDSNMMWFQATLGPIAREERFNQQREAGEAMLFAHAHGYPFYITGRR